MAQSSGMQKTLKAPIHCRGIGLHSGAHIEMVLRPAAPDSGIRFYRSDRNTEIAADWRNAIESPLCTTLTN
ncbi:MAG: UDP-3-O-acyl-N-acetylglucosamine deacetylase, partial [Alphaproteobacteria bacterium]|nr:UDP-3-O-acyl-N-acetylglucosamine deacetylase [Alphaproteobacteria bacterium]